MRTKREIFDIVKAHLLAQGARSGEGDACLYFDPDTGRRCAVGCLIPDELYDPCVEGGPFAPSFYARLPAQARFVPNRRAVVKRWAEAVPELEAYRSMLTRLQAVHDAVPVAEWADQLNAIGIDEFGLDNQDVSG